MTDFNLDTPYNHRDHNLIKWTFHPEDVLPAWVADMDFPSTPEISQAIQERANAPIFGYTMAPPDALPEAIIHRMKDLYGWEITKDDLGYIPGMVLSLNLVTRALGEPGGGVLMQTPVYGPFLNIPANNAQYAVHVDMVRVDTDDNTLRYEIDFEAFEDSINKQTKLFYLCNPHNPAGRAFTREELEKLADICLRNDVIIVADEIHSDLLLGDNKHIPIASLSPEVEAITVTLIAPSKTFNIPGLPCSIVICPNKDLREKIANTAWATGVHVSIMSFIAATAGYVHGADWLKTVLSYITDNRDYLLKTIREDMPQLMMTVPEATYLAWVDCSKLALPDGKSAQEFFLEEAKIALSPGNFFGKGTDKFVRINLAGRRETLEEILKRMKKAYDTVC